MCAVQDDGQEPEARSGGIGVMHDPRSRPFAAVAVVLLSVLPLQLSIVAPLSVGAETAQAAIAGASGGHDLSPPAPDAPHDQMPPDDMPCGEGGPCDTGLMYCSAGAICTLLFFTPPEDLPHAVQTTSSDDGWRSEPTPVTVHAGHSTPPPRA